MQELAMGFCVPTILPRVARSWRAVSSLPPRQHVRKNSPLLVRIVRCSGTDPETITIESIQEDLRKVAESSMAAVSDASDLSTLEKLRVEYLGKKGRLTAFMKSIGTLPVEYRPQIGADVNVAKDNLSELITAKKTELEEAELLARSEEEDIDVTAPGLRRRPHLGYVHPLNITIDKTVKIFLDLGYDLIDDFSEFNREIESDYYCFEALNCPADHPAREMQDTFYLEEDKSLLLRTQTSAMQVRYMEKNKPPFAIVAPGRVYRRDPFDATHSPMFHQIEILNVRKIGELNVGSLRATIIHFLREMFGQDIETRFRASYFPFTTPSMEVDVYFGEKWLEVLGCGMVDPDVLSNVGIDPDEYVGFAAGFGVERFAMVRHGITDIREFYRSDMRFLQQFTMAEDDF